MKRKHIVVVALVCVVSASAFLTPVQTFAVQAMSIFRVQDVKTLKITIADLQEGMQNLKMLHDGTLGQGKDFKPVSLVNIIMDGGMSGSIEDANFLPAFEENLRQSLKSIDGVQDASVNIVIPSKNVDSMADTQKTTASICLTTNKSLSDIQGETIAQFVSKNVKGLTMDNIKITDQNAQTIYTGYKNPSAQGPTVSSDTSVAGGGTRTLSSVDEFKDFAFKLPSKLAKETPKISTVDSHAVTFTLNVPACNDVLTKLNVSRRLADTDANIPITVTAPASVVAEYNDVALFATQRPVVDAPKDLTDELKQIMLDIPMIPEDIRSQLAAIDVNGSDIYLPVLVGVGREVSLSGSTGYLYTLADLRNFTNALPNDLKNMQFGSHSDFNSTDSGKDKDASLLIWTKNGILYSLAGTDKTDAQLAEIARSVK